MVANLKACPPRATTIFPSPIPLAEPAHPKTTKFTKKDIPNLIGPRADQQLHLLHQLMGHPLTLRTASKIYDLERLSETVARFNARFRANNSEDAIIIRKLDPSSIRGGFWVMALNPIFFRLPTHYGELKSGIDICWFDLFTPHRRMFMQQIIKDPYQTETEVKAKIPAGMYARVVEINNATLAQGYPKAILGTAPASGVSVLYYPNPEFVLSFDLPEPKCKRPIDKVLPPDWLKILNYAGDHPNCTSTEITAGTGVKWVSEKVPRIETRCAELGLPPPLNVSGKGPQTVYDLATKFRKLMKKGKAQDHLENHFTENQIKVALAIAGQPYISTAELSEILTIPKNRIFDYVEGIRKQCRARKLPRLVSEQVGRTTENIYRWEAKFFKKFGLPEGEVVIARRFRGIQRKVYDYYKGKEVVYGKVAIRDLGLTKRQLLGARLELNSKLRELGQPILPVPFWGVAIAEWSVVKAQMIEQREKRGAWPVWRKLKRPLARGVNLHGGVGAVKRRIMQELTDRELASIIFHDYAREQRARVRESNSDEITVLGTQITDAARNELGRAELLRFMGKGFSAGRIIRFIQYFASNENERETAESLAKGRVGTDSEYIRI